MGGRHASQLRSALAIGLITLSSIYVSTQAQSIRIPGFLSIDCGGSEPSYTDPFTTIVWEDDDEYIQTGTSASMSGDVSVAANLTYGNSVALSTFRYFPEHRNKHCYDLPTNANRSFLLRAMFSNGGSPLLVPPIMFSVAVNGTVWFNVTYNGLDDTPFVREAIFFSPGNLTHFCFVPITGVPFISSLELRELDEEGEMYSFPASTDNLFLYSLKRLNCGAQLSSPSVRYPEDSYDRLWYSPGFDDIPIDPISLQNSIAPVNSSTGFSTKLNAVPREVMVSAWLDDTPNSSFWMGFSFDSWVSKVYIALYLKSYNEDDATESDRMFYLFLNTNPDLHKSLNETITVENHEHLARSYWDWEVPNGYAEFIFRALPNSTRGPIVNGIELYAQVTFNTSATAAEDVDALKTLQVIFNLTTWQGDPCYPASWDWVTCTSGPVQARVNKLLMSNMGINATIPSTILNLTSLTDMNLSRNALSSLPSKWQNTSSGSLVVLDLSQNNLVGNISSLDQLVEINAKSLQEIHVSDNSLAGTFYSTLYFSRVSNLSIAIFDGNFIQGTLDLSLYLDALQNNATQATQKLFSFVNNSISNIVPNAKAFESTLKRVQASNTGFTKGILLGGNPYCERAKSDIQRFLCRHTIDEKYEERSNYHRDIMIIGICVGVAVLLLSSVTGASMWKLWKQVYALREIQQALADQKVQPPFYQYSELKSATKDFHQDNKLGCGGFGEVYKGVLQDKTDLAVKKLFNARKIQVLNEFLNEVVLITGIKHRNLVQLKGCCIREQQRLLIYEYVEKGNLAQALWGSKAHGSLNWEQRLSICVGVARGLSYLHEELQPYIIHRDIKPENILLDKNLKPKIADFGLARHLSEELRGKTLYTENAAGTLGYFSPEYATQGQISEKVDTYSYGIVVLEVVSGRKCIDRSLPLEKAFLKNWVHTMHKEGRLLDVLEPELRDSCVEAEVIQALNIALLCVQYDPEKRPSMSQVVTMFLGNMDVVSFEEPHKCRESDHQTGSPALQTVIEHEHSGLPLLNLGFESSSSGTSGSKSSLEIFFSK